MQAFRDADREVGGGYMYGAVIRYLEHQDTSPSVGEPCLPSARVSDA